MTMVFRPLIAATLAMATLSAPAMAQRDPAYQAARQSGQVGEKPDGYLGFVATPSESLRTMVEDLNLRRRAVYSERARTTDSTVEQMAFTAGCNLISQTVAGEKYMSPDGRWLTRTAAAPLRDPRCL
ncbi:MAG: YdbL family protein [Sphingopyxis sp.]